MVMHDAPRLIRMLEELRQLGVQIAVDDFGTGYSSLSYLKRFPVHRLKIDRSFVADVTRNADDAAIVRTIIALGHNLGLRVVAEGVESDEQLGFLRDNACDELQGYYFSPPVSAAEFQEQLTLVR
jgi:EAL domain-containing protein (putative c-di-GMP-specific phosphodiesterase class I)